MASVSSLSLFAAGIAIALLRAGTSTQLRKTLDVRAVNRFSDGNWPGNLGCFVAEDLLNGGSSGEGVVSANPGTLKKGRIAYMNTAVGQHPCLVVEAAPEARAAFIRRTYTHLAMAILAFIGLEIIFFQSGLARALTSTIIGSGRLGWLAVLGGFMVVSWVADKWAHSSTSLGVQYTGLSVYVLAEAIIFVPLLYIAGVYG